MKFMPVRAANRSRPSLSDDAPSRGRKGCEMTHLTTPCPYCQAATVGKPYERNRRWFACFLQRERRRK